MQKRSEGRRLSGLLASIIDSLDFDCSIQSVPFLKFKETTKKPLSSIEATIQFIADWRISADCREPSANELVSFKHAKYNIHAAQSSQHSLLNSSSPKSVFYGNQTRLHLQKITSSIEITTAAPLSP